MNETVAALIEEAVKRAYGNQGVAAGILGISRQALNTRPYRRPDDALRASSVALA